VCACRCVQVCSCQERAEHRSETDSEADGRQIRGDSQRGLLSRSICTPPALPAAPPSKLPILALVAPLSLPPLQGVLAHTGATATAANAAAATANAASAAAASPAHAAAVKSATMAATIRTALASGGLRSLFLGGTARVLKRALSTAVTWTLFEEAMRRGGGGGGG